MLTIKSVKKIIGTSYNEWLDVADVSIDNERYEFVLLSNNGHQQIEYISLNRNPTQNGKYIMEYNGEILPLRIDEFDTIQKIIVCMQNV